MDLPSFLIPSVSSMGPGAMQLIRMFCGPHSTAKCFVIASADGKMMNPFLVCISSLAPRPGDKIWKWYGSEANAYLQFIQFLVG